MIVTSEGNSQVSVIHRRAKLCSAKDSTTKHALFLIDLILNAVLCQGSSQFLDDVGPGNYQQLQKS